MSRTRSRASSSSWLSIPMRRTFSLPPPANRTLIVSPSVTAVTVPFSVSPGAVGAGRDAAGSAAAARITASVSAAERGRVLNGRRAPAPPGRCARR